MYTIAILLTCHNRKATTMQCLSALHGQQRLGIDFAIEIFLVDDASTDGTSNEVKMNYPAVNILSGNGNLYWNRGMHFAWETAAKTKEYDYYLWLNDDTFLFEKAISPLLQNPLEMEIICGTTHSIKSLIPNYGGIKRNSRTALTPNGDFQECDYFNGNFVLIPHKVFKLVGNLDSRFHHAIGDFDYGLRAKNMGVRLLVAPNFIGICESHSTSPQWASPSQGVIKRIKLLYSPSSGCYPPQFFIFDKRHNGFFIAVFHFFTIHLRALVPALWKSMKDL